MARNFGSSKFVNATRARKRVEADTTTTTTTTTSSTTKNGSAFTQCYACNKDVAVGLISMHDCGFEAKIKMNLKTIAVEAPAEPVAKKHAADLQIADHAQDRSGDAVYVELREVGAAVTQVAMTSGLSIVGYCFDASAHAFDNESYVHLGLASALNSKDQHLHFFGPQRSPSKKETIPSNIHVVQQPDAIVTTPADTIRPPQPAICTSRPHMARAQATRPPHLDEQANNDIQ
nr:hypothetical protein [Tanacetum cinerariifolium]